MRLLFFVLFCWGGGGGGRAGGDWCLFPLRSGPLCIQGRRCRVANKAEGRNLMDFDLGSCFCQQGLGFLVFWHPHSWRNSCTRISNPCPGRRPRHVCTGMTDEGFKGFLVQGFLGLGSCGLWVLGSGFRVKVWSLGFSRATLVLLDRQNPKP